MANIITFKNPNKNITNLTKDDIFNLLLIYKSKDQILPTFDLEIIMELFANYKNNERFKDIYSNLEVDANKNGKEIINLENCLDKNIKERIIYTNPNNKSEITILADEKYFTELEKEYNDKILTKFYDLMFFIDMDIEHGVGNWKIVFEDEYIKHPQYPGFITGEFIGQEKDEKVMKKIKQRAIENLKNLYE